MSQIQVSHDDRVVVKVQYSAELFHLDGFDSKLMNFFRDLGFEEENAGMSLIGKRERDFEFSAKIEDVKLTTNT